MVKGLDASHGPGKVLDDKTLWDWSRRGEQISVGEVPTEVHAGFDSYIGELVVKRRLPDEYPLSIGQMKSRGLAIAKYRKQDLGEDVIMYILDLTLLRNAEVYKQLLLSTEFRKDKVGPVIDRTPG